MARVPQIEICSWDYQQDTSPQSHSGLTQVDCLPIPNIRDMSLACGTQPGRKQPRTNFWSRLRRSKSDTASLKCSPPPYSPAPQPATAGAKLVWSPEQHMWLFAREDDDMRLSPNGYHDRPESRSTKKYKKTKSKQRPVTLPPPSPRRMSGEDEMMFAQMPGHYSLSVYDYVGDESLQRPSAPTTPTTPTTPTDVTIPESPWMAVASRLSQHDPLR